jgi:hypothetical protein
MIELISIIVGLPLGIILLSKILDNCVSLEYESAQHDNVWHDKNFSK